VLVNAAAFSGPNSSRPIVIPDVMNMDALADVWAMIEKHLPAEYRSKFTWQQLAALLQRVAEGQQDVSEVTALRIVFFVSELIARPAVRAVRARLRPESSAR
jgi:hypothetical protein